MQFLDILIFAVIAVLLVLRLRSVLGQRTGYEQPQDESGVSRSQKGNNDNEPVQLYPENDGPVLVAEQGLDANFALWDPSI